MKVLIGIKNGMTRFYEGDKSIPVTVVMTEGAVVSDVKTDGYELGIGKKLSRPNKALSGKYQKLGYVPSHRIWVAGESEFKVGDTQDIQNIEPGTRVNITGVTKGKGFAGVVKRWGFHGGPKTHGQSDRLRAPGSIGAGTTPGRVLKGKKMAGRMGSDKITVQNKRIVAVGPNYLLISGAVPGTDGDPVTIKIQ